MSLNNSKNKNNLLYVNDVLGTYKSKPHGIKALSKYKNWFPIKASPALAGICADLMGDGHLQGPPKWRIDYTSKSIQELNRFENEIYTLFGVKGKIRDCTTNKYSTMNLGVNNKPLARILKLIGVPYGAKVLIDFRIPDWIIKNKELFSRYINRLFSCEGCVDLQNRYIEIKMYKRIELLEEGISFFKDIKQNLSVYYEISTTNPFFEKRCNLRKDGIKTKGVKLKIKKKDSLMKFRKYIGFDDPAKKIKLNRILEE